MGHKGEVSVKRGHAPAQVEVIGESVAKRPSPTPKNKTVSITIVMEVSIKLEWSTKPESRGRVERKVIEGEEVGRRGRRG